MTRASTRVMPAVAQGQRRVILSLACCIFSNGDVGIGGTGTQSSQKDEKRGRISTRKNLPEGGKNIKKTKTLIILVNKK